MKKYSKNEILWHRVLLCLLVARINDKLEFWQNLQKNPSHKGLSSMNMNMFQAKWPSYGHSRGIVSDKVPIFGKKCILVWETMVPNWFFDFFLKNIIFHFLSVKNDIFCEASTRNMVQNGTHSIFTQTSPYLMGNPKL